MATGAAAVENRIAASSAVASAKNRDGLISLLHRGREAYKEWVRRAVIQRNRVDVLAELVLGYTVHPRVHFPIIQHQLRNPQSMTLAFRTAGKTTIGTIAKMIHVILKNPNFHVILASKVAENAEDMLGEVKGHFESNEELRDIFGDYVGDKQWDERSIVVRPRTRNAKEPTVATVGVGSAVASKHYDIGFGDDLLDETNSRTDHQRQSIKTWYYKVFKPCILPPDPLVDHRGEIHILGTRYHYEDLYQHFQDHEYKGKTLVIPALDENDQSVYPEKFKTAYLHELREDAGPIIFNSQYQCNTEAMKGEIFAYDDCDIVPAESYPALDRLKVGVGVDLAIGEGEQHDFFAIVVVGEDEHGHLWVLDFIEQRLSFSAQQATIEDVYQRFERSIIGAFIEANAYQKAQPGELKKKHPSWLIRPVLTHRDKVTRAWKLTPIFEQRRIHFMPHHTKLIDRLVSFPHGKRDLFDALDFAITGLQGKRLRERTRRAEPGLM